MSLIIRKGKNIYYPKYMIDRNISIQLQRTLQVYPTHILLALRPTNGYEFDLCSAGRLRIECLPSCLGRMGLMLLPMTGLVSVTFDTDSEDHKNILTADFHLESTMLGKEDIRVYGADLGLEQIAKSCILEGLSPKKALKETLFINGCPDIEVVKTTMGDLFNLLPKED